MVLPQSKEPSHSAQSATRHNCCLLGCRSAAVLVSAFSRSGTRCEWMGWGGLEGRDGRTAGVQASALQRRFNLLARLKNNYTGGGFFF